MTDPAAELPLSVVVTTFNEAPNVGRCLESVVNWCPVIFVVDSGSDDETIEIARRYTDRIFTHSYESHPAQWRWALESLPIETEWILALDADNVVTTELRDELPVALAKASANVAGFYNPHRHFFRNREVRGLKGDWLRVVRRNAVHVDESELVDLRFVVQGEVQRLRGAIVESNQKELSIDFWIDKHQAFARRMAAEEVLRAHGRRASTTSARLFGSSDERMVWLKSRWRGMPLFVRPVVYFAYRYLLKRGFLDGANGFAYHALQAFWFRLLVDLNIDAIRTELAAGLSLDELESRLGGIGSE